MLPTRSRSRLLEQAIARKFALVCREEYPSSLTFPCRFCGQDEEQDPGEEFEEWLACAVCGDNGKFPVLHFFSLESTSETRKQMNKINVLKSGVASAD